MKKQTSAVAIIVAVIFSIVLFPFIVVTGISSGVIFSMESVFQQNREEEIYQSFVKSGGEEYIYELLLEGAESEIGEFDVDPEEFFPREQVNTMIDDIYHALLKGEKYQVDLSIQKEVTKKYARREFDANIEIEIEKALKDEYGAAYDLLSESEKQELIQTATVEARNIFEEEIDSAVEAEFSALEKEFSAEINGIYDTSEYQELKALEEEYGFSLTDRTELCYYLNLGGYLMLGLSGVFVAVLLLCHLFRPSGFFTAGAFTLITGGLMMVMAKGLQGIFLSLLSAEISAEYTAEEFPEFLMPMIEEVLGWCMVGFEKSGKVFLMAAVILVLVGILLFIIRRNKEAAEPASVLEMQ